MEISSRKWKKDIEYNGQRKKDKIHTIAYLQKATLKIEQHHPPPKKKNKNKSWSEHRCTENASSSCSNIDIRYATVKQHEDNLICKSYLTPV